MYRIILMILLISGCAFAPHITTIYAPTSTYAPVYYTVPAPRPSYIAPYPPQPTYSQPAVRRYYNGGSGYYGRRYD